MYSIYVNDKLIADNVAEEYVYSIAESVGKIAKNLCSDVVVVVSYHEGRHGGRHEGRKSHV